MLPPCLRILRAVYGFPHLFVGFPSSLAVFPSLLRGLPSRLREGPTRARRACGFSAFFPVSAHLVVGFPSSFAVFPSRSRHSPRPWPRTPVFPTPAPLCSQLPLWVCGFPVAIAREPPCPPPRHMPEFNLAHRAHHHVSLRCRSPIRNPQSQQIHPASLSRSRRQASQNERRLARRQRRHEGPLGRGCRPLACLGSESRKPPLERLRYAFPAGLFPLRPL